MNIEEYLDSFFKGTKDPSLDAMEFFMDEYNNFHNNMKFIHVAGTNGKGSCVEMLNKVLMDAGYTVGKFISPHLIDYNERISVNGVNISNSEMEEIIEELKVKVQKYNDLHATPVTLFELETTMALLYFYRKNVNIVVLETGMGGLFDCTNIVNPLVSIITSVGYDHMDVLGNTLEEIAFQKAGIIKQNSATVVVEQEECVDSVFIEKCKNEKNELHLIKKSSLENYSYNSEYQKFDYKNWKSVEVNLKGIKQISNAAICLETVEILRKLGYKIEDGAVRSGLKTVKHRARFETINKEPLMIYDGGHNEAAIRNLQNTISEYYSNRKKRYIVFILKRKDYKTALKLLLIDLDAEYIFTDGTGEDEYCTKEELFELAKEINPEVTKIKKMTTEEALKYAQNGEKDIVNFVLGSFYTYKKVMEILEG